MNTGASAPARWRTAASAMRVTVFRAGVKQRLRERPVEAGSVGCFLEPTDAGCPVRRPPAMRSRRRACRSRGCRTSAACPEPTGLTRIRPCPADSGRRLSCLHPKTGGCSESRR